ncbi:hypothetical protein [Cetobacterium sp. SF1]|uniref:hypothetical protein n=1 Tax=Cetobacterium sp. SF1 TaxID=3417654 RepID=UPI003CFA8E20
MKNQNQEITKKEYYDSEDELDLMELLNILLREKKTIMVTFLIVALLSLGGALWERNQSKRAMEILRVDTEKLKDFKVGDLLPLTVVESVYKSENIEKNNKLSLDKFKEKFQVTPIIPKSIQEKREFLSKSGETLEYTPENYRVDLRVGSIGESLNILNNYSKELQEYYGKKYLNQYTFKSIPMEILRDGNYDYLDYIDMIESRKNSLESILKNRADEKINYASYGYGYREVEVALNNLETLDIGELRNYLEATNIVRNTEEFKSQYRSRREKLLREIEEGRAQGENYLKMINSYGKIEGNEIIPKGIRIQDNTEERDKFYVELMNKYVNSQLKMEGLKNQLAILDKMNRDLRVGNEEEVKDIEKQLEVIIEKYNGIVEEANRLEYKESYIENGALIKLASPVVVESKSKAKLILGAGLVMGAFLGVAMAFLKNFIGEFKGNRGLLGMIVVFFLVGFKGYSKDLIVTYTHSQVERGLNPDETPFNPILNIKDKFLTEELGVDEKQLKEVTVEAIIPKGIDKNVENHILNGENYIYVPSQYRIKIEVTNPELREKLEKSLIEEYPKFYTDYFLGEIKSNGVVEYVEEYRGYRKILESFGNMIGGIQREINNRIATNKSKDIEYEYKNINIELEKLKMVNYRNISDYINSNYFVENLKLERVLLRGKIDRLKNELLKIEGNIEIYGKILKNYKVSDRRVKILENGDISMDIGGNGLKDREYIGLNRTYMNQVNKKILLENEIKKNEDLLKNMREPNGKEREKIENDLNSVQKILNGIIINMRSIELKDYRREYIGSVKVTLDNQ